MSNVSGLVLFSPNRTITSTSTLTPVSSVAVTLYNPITQIGASVLSDTYGIFEFSNVPNGNYTLVETYGIANSQSSPLDFNTAKVIPAPVPNDPPPSAIALYLPSGANAIDSMTPNVINLTVNSSDLLYQHFIDAPFANTPVTILNQISVGPNLITLADNGTFGSNPTGSYINTTPATNPYPDLAKGFGYQPYSNSTPNDGYISIVNIQTLSSFGNWWNLTDHTTGDESGNFLVVNGDNPGKSIFSQKVSVYPSTYYAFSSWIINQDSNPNEAEPKFSVNVTGISGTISNTFFSESSSNLPILTTVPNWVQTGVIFNSLDYSTVLIDFISEGPALSGNDYAIDDISLKEVIIDSNIVQTSKSVSNLANPSSLNANPLDILLYTIPITNTSPDYSLVNITIADTISNGLTFIPESVVGGTIVSYSANNPVVISTKNIAPGSSSTISFQVLVNSNITIPNISNFATLNYGILIDPNLSPAPGFINTNIVNTPVNIAALDVNKNILPSTSSNGNIVHYSVDIKSTGVIAANNVLFSDSIPSGLVFQPGSVYINNINIPTISAPNNSISTTLPDIHPGSSSNINFNAVVNTISQATLINTSTISYNYFNGSTISPTNIISSSATLSISSSPSESVSLTKGSSSSNMRIYDTNIYTITISNNTNNNLTNVIFYDTLPCGVEYIKKTFTINSINADVCSMCSGVALGTIPSETVLVVSFKIKLAYVGCNLVLNNSSCITYNISQSSQSQTSCSNVDTITIINTNNCAYLDCEKTVYPGKVYNNDTVTYTIDLYNDGCLCANNIYIMDIIPSQLSFKPESLYINKEHMPCVSPINGVLSVTIPCIYPEYFARVEFDAIVNTISNSKIISTSTISYNYFTDCHLSNTITTSVSATLSVNTIPRSKVVLNKSALFDYVRLNRGNTYTVVISNNSGETLNNVLFYDELSSEMQYVPYSFIVNGCNYKLKSMDYGVMIENIKPHSRVIIKFKVKIVSMGDSNILDNVAHISYNTFACTIPNTIYSNTCSVNLIDNNC